MLISVRENQMIWLGFYFNEYIFINTFLNVRSYRWYIEILWDTLTAKKWKKINF